MRDSHMHTPLCKHAGDFPPSEYARSAIERDNPLVGIAFTCHSPPAEAPNGEWSPHVRMSKEQYPEYLQLISDTAKEFAGQLEILTGLEVDFIPEKIFVEDVRAMLSEYTLDWVLGSVHPHMPQYQSLYAQREEGGEIDFRQFQKTYFEHLALAAEATLSNGSAMFDVIAHPDLVKVVSPKHWDPTSILEEVIEPTLDRIANTGVALEVNTSGLIKPPGEINPNFDILKAIARRGIPVVVGSDAHAPNRVGASFDQALSDLRASGISDIVVPIGGRKFQKLDI